VLATHGFAGVSVKQIAEARCSTGALYANGADKEPLFIKLPATKRSRCLA
jgi:AcrR family transcriptional regulator